MNRLRRVELFALACTLAASSCVTRQVTFPQTADPPSAPRADSAPTIGLALVRDDRPSHDAGYIGALKLTVGTEASSYLRTRTADALHEKGFHVVTAPSLDEVRGARDHARNLVLTLQSISIRSPDVVLEPTEAAAVVSAQLFDQAGTVVYSQVFYGRKTERIGFVADMPAVAGRMVAAALEDAIENMMDDAGFLPAARRASWGEGQGWGAKVARRSERPCPRWLPDLVLAFAAPAAG